MSGKLRPVLLNQVLEELNIMERQAHPAFGKAKRDCIRELVDREFTKNDIDLETINEAISHYQYGINCDIFSEPVTSYAKLAIKALEQMRDKNN
jgi:hypothetical protein